MKKCFYTLAFSIASILAYSQDAGVKSLTLDDLSAFKSQAGNWQIVGDVTMDPTIEIQHEQKTEVTDKKKKSKTPEVKPPQAVSFQPGKGVLLNLNDETKKDNLVSAFEHGDLELELEVMIPKGSNSGIYLQGRYEVQLLDSWGVVNPKYSDIGGIYRNWEREPGKIYMGKAPLRNPAKAPGLWQKLKISFRAPKFDANGNKIANARFTSVELNGIKIHDNLEVPLPTGGPIENNETASGPLMIQGDHGPVAFRNIKYRLMKDAIISVSDVTYKTYHGNFKSIADFTSLKPFASGSIPQLSCEVLDVENGYGISYAGNVTVPEDGNYEFELGYTGGIKCVVNNQTVIDIQRPDAGGRDRESVALKAGKYPFEIHNFKDASWMPPRLGVFVKTSNTYPQALHAFNSYPPDDEPVSPILLNAGSTPKLVRAFTDFKGNRAKRLTHTIGVGDPSGTHYIYDLKSGNIICVWHGEFVDATPMWHDRGDGSFKPLGAAQFLFLGQPIGFLQNESESFPDTYNENDFKGKGYVIEESTSRPIFKYNYKGQEVEDKIYPDDKNQTITHEVNFKNTSVQQGFYYKLAEGKSITMIRDGLYAVDDKQYYVKTDPASPPTILEVAGKKELIYKVTGKGIKYSLIW